MIETTCPRESLNWDPGMYAWPRHAQETSSEIPSDEINTPASTTSDSFVRASLPQAAPPSNTSLNGQLSQRLLELISLRQIALDHPIDPASYITKLKASGEEHFVRHLVVQIEDFLELPQRYGLALEERIQDVKQRCEFLECPRYERPNIYPLDTRDWICEVERYEPIKTNHLAWPDGCVESYALVYLSQSFGRLQYTLPTNMGPDGIPNAAALLISLHEERRKQYGVGSFTPTISLKLRIPGFPEVLGPYYQLQREKGEFLGTYVDWQYIQKHGGNSYIQHLRRYYIRKHGKNSRLEDVQLRDYKELANMFQGYPAIDMTVSQLIEDLQEFQKAWTDLKDWSKEDTPSLTWLYVAQLLAILGFKASMKEFLRDPRKVLRNVYCMLQWESRENDHECPPEMPPSSTHRSDADESPLCSDTESLTDGEEDDTALNSDANTDGYIDADDCYGLLRVFNDHYSLVLLRLFGLCVAIQEHKIGSAKECLLCHWSIFANLVASSGLDGALSIIEPQLSLVPSSGAKLLERVRRCERELGMKDFSLLQSALPDTWMPLNQAIGHLWDNPRFRPEDSEISEVLRSPDAVIVYLAGCVAKLGYILPKDQSHRSQEISNKAWYLAKRDAGS